MSYSAREKFTQPLDGVVWLGPLTDDELCEGDQRIAAGEFATDVWRDIARRDPDRWRSRVIDVGRRITECG